MDEPNDQDARLEQDERDAAQAAAAEAALEPEEPASGGDDSHAV